MSQNISNVIKIKYIDLNVTKRKFTIQFVNKIILRHFQKESENEEKIY